MIQALREAQLWLRDVNKNQLLKWIKDSGFTVNIKDWLKEQNKQPFSSPALNSTDLCYYEAGSWGPVEAALMLQKEGRSWWLPGRE